MANASMDTFVSQFPDEQNGFSDSSAEGATLQGKVQAKHFNMNKSSNWWSVS